MSNWVNEWIFLGVTNECGWGITHKQQEWCINSCIWKAHFSVSRDSGMPQPWSSQHSLQAAGQSRISPLCGYALLPQLLTLLWLPLETDLPESSRFLFSQICDLFFVTSWVSLAPLPSQREHFRSEETEACLWRSEDYPLGLGFLFPSCGCRDLNLGFGGKWESFLIQLKLSEDRM